MNIKEIIDYWLKSAEENLKKQKKYIYGSDGNYK